ncbi:MAG TPA: hypothetical protein VN457_00900, partial [Chlamydiales bacterium]|nr:hypothetical protein [Chlamydiales bacterium]
IVGDRYKTLLRATNQVTLIQQRQASQEASQMGAASAATGSATTSAIATSSATVVTSSASITSPTSSASAQPVNLTSSSQSSDATGAVSSSTHASVSASVALLSLPPSSAPASASSSLPALPVAPQVASPADRQANDKGGSVGFRRIERISANDFLAALENVPKQIPDYSIIKQLAQRLDFPKKSVQAAFRQLNHWQQLFLFEAAGAKNEATLLDCIVRSYTGLEDAQEKVLFKSYIEQYQNDAAVSVRYKMILAAINAPRG